MTEKRFKIVNDCGDYHLMNGDERLGYDLCSPAMRKANWNKVVDKLNEQDNEIQRLSTENRTLKITYAKCRDCKHADLYNPEFAYPYLDPQCKLNVKKIHSDSDACEDFEMIGRNSR